MKNFLIILWVIFVFAALTLLIWHEIKSHRTAVNKTAHAQQSMCLPYLTNLPVATTPVLPSTTIK